MIKVAEIIYLHDPEELDQQFIRGVRNGLRVSSQFWRLNYLEKHFTTGGAREYGYQKRTKEYQIRKAKKKKHQRPLEWSGTLRSMVLGQFPQPRMKADEQSIIAHMRLQVPTYTFYTKTKSGTPSPPKYDELVKTSDAETVKFDQLICDAIDVAMRKGGRSKIVKP